MEKINPIGLVVGLPTRGNKVGFEWSLCMAGQNYPINTNRWTVPCKGKPIDEARTKIAKFALEKKAKYLFFIDDDTAPPFHACRKLMYDLEQADDDVMIAGGIYTTKEQFPAPIVFNGNGAGPFWKWKKGELFECSGIGTGCMLIKTEVFTKIEEPWFKTIDNPPDGQKVLEIATDDLYFCQKVTDAGFKILADGSVLCVHWDYSTDPPTPYYLPEDSYPMKEEIAQGRIAI
jgi:hypothetical protein